MSKAKDDKADAKAAEARLRALKKFDLDNPEFPPELDAVALASGGYPYDERLKRKVYEDELIKLQLELLKLQTHVAEAGERIVVLFEGRDTSGKGGCISRILARLNPRHARSVALSKPTESERGQWYFQRYIAHLPTRGDILLFDRSWYNRAGVEPVMGFCTPEQTANFLRDAPAFEELLVRDGIRFFKIYLTVGREMQLKRFHERRHEPFKQWKITEVDRAAIGKYDAYTHAEREMLRFTHTAVSPWTVIAANDQRRARLEAMRVILTALDYPGKDKDVVGALDPKITKSGADHLAGLNGEDEQGAEA
ncbi:UDP-galactose-lipid carrier transferase [Hyphomicrobium nitrativorans NL23]|uniref:ADP/GDP-polyphosphate phosphotransferase n=1 Tax=Hyphomicrobium nitrativorans NL23 TaxID=1029756 RepID=V5S9U6_9HYPH|nr:polyphosphate kinase 2 [Hyphomicrobium nitrativorans]AHB47398.1 UDP-galactose-lipid carrier transferase [Hyphomicrobium nitrativorans NL23]